ncbi:MAG: hypothetical protein IJR17_00910 [Clostridia bacterium]|nr:hypothetical protein [Clostridia bacterium]
MKKFIDAELNTVLLNGQIITMSGYVDDGTDTQNDSETNKNTNPADNGTPFINGIG